MPEIGSTRTLEEPKIFIKPFLIATVILFLNHMLSLISLGEFYDNYLDDILFNVLRFIVYIYLGVIFSLNRINRKITLLSSSVVFFIDHIILRIPYYLVVFSDSNTSSFGEYFSSIHALLASYIVFLPVICCIVLVGYFAGIKIKQKAR